MTYIDGKFEGENAGGDQEKTRKKGRDSLFMQGILHIPGATQPVTVRVRNLAAGGLMADFSGSIQKDSEIQIELRNVGLVSGRVAWVSPNQFGMAFDKEIDPQAVRRPVVTKRDDLFRPVTLNKYSHYSRKL